MTAPVLHVITGLGGGGAERMLDRVARAAASGGAPQVVVSLGDEGLYAASLRVDGVAVDHLGMKPGARGLMQLPSAIMRLARVIRQHKPRCVMTWLYHADLAGLLAARLGGCRRVVWNLRCSDMAFSRYARTTRWTAAILARLSRMPDAVAVNSHAGRRAHAALGYRPRRWVTLHNGFDTDLWRPDADDRRDVRRAWGVEEDAFVVGMVARVDPQKDHDTFLNACAMLASQCPRARFVLIGEGTDSLPLPAALEGRVDALGHRPDARRQMRGLDLAVLSAAYGEGFPNAVGEAMATAVPCAVTDVGDSARIVGETGWVAPRRNPAALAEAMNAALSMPSQELAARGRAARDRVRAHYTLARALAAYAAVWDGDWASLALDSECLRP